MDSCSTSIVWRSDVCVGQNASLPVIRNADQQTWIDYRFKSGTRYWLALLPDPEVHAAVHTPSPPPPTAPVARRPRRSRRRAAGSGRTASSSCSPRGTNTGGLASLITSTRSTLEHFIRSIDEACNGALSFMNGHNCRVRRNETSSTRVYSKDGEWWPMTTGFRPNFACTKRKETSGMLSTRQKLVPNV